ncbi:MAG TPA: hypothetical protein VGC09_04155 [Rhodopila sp.]
MKSLSPTRRDGTTVAATFVSQREAAKLAEMLEIATEDLERVSGGAAAALAKSTACCCCHHGSLA